jgi:hypothetical protein
LIEELQWQLGVSRLFSDRKVIVAGIGQLLILGRGDLDLVGSTLNKG